MAFYGIPKWEDISGVFKPAASPPKPGGKPGGGLGGLLNSFTTGLAGAANAGMQAAKNYQPPATPPPGAVPAPKIEQGNWANELLFSKNAFEKPGSTSGEQEWARNNAKQYYDQLGGNASYFQNMNAAELNSWIKSQQQQGAAAVPEKQKNPNEGVISNGGASTNLPQNENGWNFNPNDALKNAPQIPKPAVDPIPVRSRSDIQKYVEAQIARKLADAKLSRDQAIQSAKTTKDQSKATINGQLQTAVTRLSEGARQSTEGVTTGFNRLKEDTGEDRVLADTRLQDQLNPFSGRSDYAKGLIGRERERTDREQQADYMSRLGNINQELANNKGAAEIDATTRMNALEQDAAGLETQLNQKYQALESAAPDEREALIRSIEADERQYQMMLRGEDRNDVMANAQLTQQAFGQALSTFNTNRGVYESDRNYNWDTDKFKQQMDFQKSQSDYDLAMKLGQQYGAPVDPRSNMWDQVSGKNPMSRDQFEWQKQQGRDEFEWQKQYQQGQLDADKTRAGQAGQGTDLGWANLTWEIEKAKKSPGTPININSFHDMLDKTFRIENPYSKEVSYGPGLRDAIIQMELPDMETDRLLASYGLPVSGKSGN